MESINGLFIFVIIEIQLAKEVKMKDKTFNKWRKILILLFLFFSKFVRFEFREKAEETDFEFSEEKRPGKLIKFPQAWGD